MRLDFLKMVVSAKSIFIEDYSYSMLLLNINCFQYVFSQSLCTAQKFKQSPQKSRKSRKSRKSPLPQKFKQFAWSSKR